MTIKRNFIVIEGIVQGVGFRPFIYNLANSLDLKGYVNNNSEGVHIDVEGHKETINKFLQRIEQNPPPLARIEKISVREETVLTIPFLKSKKVIQHRIRLP